MRICLILLVLTATTLFPGCRHGPDLGLVQGTVTLDGRPLAGAIVVFAPKAGGHASRAITDDAGRYQLIYLRDAKGALVGSHTVRVFSASEDDPKERVPARYNKKSTLTAEVARGTNEYNVNLTSK